MKVYVCYNDDYEDFEIAKDLKTAIKYFINSLFYKYEENEDFYKLISFTFDTKATKDNYKDILMNASIEDFNDCFEEWVGIFEQELME